MNKNDDVAYLEVVSTEKNASDHAGASMSVKRAFASFTQTIVYCAHLSRSNI